MSGQRGPFDEDNQNPLFRHDWRDSTKDEIVDDIKNFVDMLQKLADPHNLCKGGGHIGPVERTRYSEQCGYYCHACGRWWIDATG